MPAPVVHGIRTTPVSPAATSTTVLLPDGSNVTGYLVLILAGKDGQGAFTFPSGWTNVADPGGSGGVRGEVRYRIIDGTEGFDGTDDSISVTHASEETVIRAVTIKDWHGSTAPEGASGTGVSGAANPPSLTPSWGAAENLWIALAVIDAASNVTAYPTNYTGNQDTDESSTTDADAVTNAIATRELNAASDDPGAFTNPSDGWITFTVAVRPGSGTTLSPGSIVRTRAFGTPTVNPTLNVPSIVRTRAFGTPTVNPTLNVPSIVRTRAFGSHTVAGGTILAPNSIVHTRAFGSHLVTSSAAVPGAGRGPRRRRPGRRRIG